MLVIVQTVEAFYRRKYVPRAVNKQWAVNLNSDETGDKLRRVYGPESLDACQRFMREQRTADSFIG